MATNSTTTNTANGETHLPTLLRTLNPVLHPSIFIYLTYPPSTNPPPPSVLPRQLSFDEIEGLTIVTTQSAYDAYYHQSAVTNNSSPSSLSPASAGRDTSNSSTSTENPIYIPEPTFPCRMLSLTVHSALAGVGLFAAISNALAKAGVPSNAVSGYFHDHVFVPVGREGDAMAVLEGLRDDALAVGLGVSDDSVE